MPSAGGIGGAPSANFTITDANIEVVTNECVQITGISTGTDHHTRISDAPATNQLQVHKATTESFLIGQSVIPVGQLISLLDRSPSQKDLRKDYLMM